MSSQNLASSVDYGGAVTDGFRNIATFVPKLLGFLVILLVGYVIAKVVATLVDKALERVGFDKGSSGAALSAHSTTAGTTRPTSSPSWCSTRSSSRCCPRRSANWASRR